MPNNLKNGIPGALYAGGLDYGEYPRNVGGRKQVVSDINNRLRMADCVMKARALCNPKLDGDIAKGLDDILDIIDDSFGLEQAN